MFVPINSIKSYDNQRRGHTRNLSSDHEAEQILMSYQFEAICGIRKVFSCGHVTLYKALFVRWSIRPSVVIELESVKKRISAPAHPSTTGIDRVSSHVYDLRPRKPHPGVCACVFRAGVLLAPVRCTCFFCGFQKLNFGIQGALNP